MFHMLRLTLTFAFTFLVLASHHQELVLLANGS